MVFLTYPRSENTEAHYRKHLRGIIKQSPNSVLLWLCNGCSREPLGSTTSGVAVCPVCSLLYVEYIGAHQPIIRTVLRWQLSRRDSRRNFVSRDACKPYSPNSDACHASFFQARASPAANADPPAAVHPDTSLCLFQVLVVAISFSGIKTTFASPR